VEENQASKPGGNPAATGSRRRDAMCCWNHERALVSCCPRQLLMAPLRSTSSVRTAALVTATRPVMQ
jgi:hypothetical protein